MTLVGGLIGAVIAFGALLGFGSAVRWLVENYPQFGIGFCCGIIVMVLLYWLAERTGTRETRY